MRRPGAMVALVFVVGALLGISTSAVFLGVDATTIDDVVGSHGTSVREGIRSASAEGQVDR